MRRAGVRVTVSAAAAAGVLAAGYAGSAQAHTDGLDDVRASTAAFHATSQAEAAGYGDPGLPCFDSPSTNQGMGFHLVNGDLLNDGGQLSRTHPEALVYEMHDGTLKLVAVEYIVKMSDAATAPHFLGQQMVPNPSLGLWTLHAWIWRKNPQSLFASYNANVPLCPR
ncbi:hypothetical protein [Nocardioides pocheonensis]|uniref:Allene oxide cyclase barrel-like domain-containing protein n=1 Tax=Nocardioides pocheonensis TaxID=661485 RepID=A0A3N0GP42_9ACTN|nr:hypothetical protein [Nocardioides pocheonensis]RNM14199.1 hypothetical protein EFL26_14860 [Nocardioides pocheonensis]